jgi:hypothetical protein
MIRHEGDTAERLFFAAVPEAFPPEAASFGDARILVDGCWHHLEIKECHARTINQVRPIHYTPLVVYAPGHEPPWAVIAPDTLVRLACGRARGQHTEIPFECCALTLGVLPDSCWCRAEELAIAAGRAVRHGLGNQRLIAAMIHLGVELRELDAATKIRVLYGGKEAK